VCVYIYNLQNIVFCWRPRERNLQTLFGVDYTHQHNDTKNRTRVVELWRALNDFLALTSNRIAHVTCIFDRTFFLSPGCASRWHHNGSHRERNLELFNNRTHSRLRSKNSVFGTFIDRSFEELVVFLSARNATEKEFRRSSECPFSRLNNEEDSI